MSEKTETRYSEGKIYKLCIPGADEFSYIGSTVKELHKRLSEHKCSANSDSKYKFSSKILFEDDNVVECVLIELFPCKSKQELLVRERFWLDKFPDAINKNSPIVTRAEWRTRQAAASLARYHKLKVDDPEEFAKRAAIHKEWQTDNKEHIAEYQLANRDTRVAQEKVRYDAGYGAIRSDRKKEKIKCPTCQKEMNKSSLWLHKKTHLVV